MDGNEIRFQISEIDKQIKAELNKFVLTDKIQKLLTEKENLQHLCNHNFKDGVCIYCTIKVADL